MNNRKITTEIVPEEWVLGVYAWVERSGKKPYKLVCHRQLMDFKCQLFAEDGSVIVAFTDSETGLAKFDSVFRLVCEKYKFDLSYHVSTVITRDKQP